MIDDVAERLRRILDGGISPLPVRPDLAAANAWLAETHLEAWSL